MMQPHILLCRHAFVSVIVIGKIKKKKKENVANGVLSDVEHGVHTGSYPGIMSRSITVQALT